MNSLMKHYVKLTDFRSIISNFPTGHYYSANGQNKYNNIIRRLKSDEIIHVESNEPSIPPYVERQDEDIKLKRARLLYQSRKRGMLENGLVLSTFAKKYLDTFNEQELKLYDKLINLPSNDWDIFYWATGVKKTPDEFNNEIMDLLKQHVRNDDRQSRLVQPDL